MFGQEYFLLETVLVPALEAPGLVIGTAEPDRRPAKDGEERLGYRYLVEIRLPPKLRWLTAEEIEPWSGEDDFGADMIPANDA